ncbi:MAG: DUF4091 domain-containing protein [Clostridia bacterium]|nr:DUF4091 domain-containing protein [Clostridia bacterium]
MPGIITSRQQFFFPDSPLGDLPASLRLVSAKNGKSGLQILFSCDAPQGSVRVCAGGFDAELFEMIAVPVEYNTGNGVDQGGAMVILPDTCPDYAVRKAPFDVFDCLRPLSSCDIPAHDGRCSAYLTLAPRDDTPAGSHTLTLLITAGHETHTCRIEYVVYPVAFDEDLFETTNWFSVRAMEQVHGVKIGTPEFDDVVRAYARSMRSVHQKVFLLWLHEDLSDRRVAKPYHFDFEDMAPIIRIFFEEGFDTFETGGIICRGYREDGTQDMYTADFKCSADPTVSVDSDEGYALLCSEMQAFAAFLKKYGWEDRVLFHVMDEPDVHYKTEADLTARRVQFLTAANIVRRYLPGVRIMEAVKTLTMRGGVDIMVPITDSYQHSKAAFDAAIAMGDEVWTYVCCAPEGKWLNRFLDSPLLNGRLLFWGCAACRFGGYLHWGYNQFGGVPDPFKATSARNWTGIGTNFPCGDAFIVYPGEKEPWPSMRLEAERMGAQEACLLRALRDKDPAAHDALIAEVFTSFDEYDNDPAKMELVHEELLKMLSK